jgi:hypothetical protein
MSLLEIAELLACLQLNSSQLQELSVALTDIVTRVKKPTQQTPDETFNLINADDVPLLTTAAPTAIAAEPAEPTVVSSLSSSTGDRDEVPDAPSIVTTTPSAVTPAGAAVVAAPVPVAAPAAASTTRVFNGVSYQYPVDSASGPFYLVTRGRDIGVFVGWSVFLLL